MLSTVQGEYVKLWGGRGAAALQDLAERAARNLSRQRLGVRLSSAAFIARGTRVGLLASCAAWCYCAREISFDSVAGDTPRIGQMPSIVCITK